MDHYSLVSLQHLAYFDNNKQKNKNFNKLLIYLIKIKMVKYQSNKFNLLQLENFKILGSQKMTLNKLLPKQTKMVIFKLTFKNL